MTATRDLYHDGALCPECGLRVGVPDIPEGDDPCVPPPGSLAQEMRCASCDHEWCESNYHELARAWFAHGAHEQHLVEERRNHAVTELLVSVEAKTVAGIVALARNHRDQLARARDNGSFLASGGWRALDSVLKIIEAGEWRKTDDER